MFYAYDGKQNSAFILYNENKYGKIIGIFDGEFNAAAGDIKYKLKLEEIAVQEDCVVYDAMRSKATICSTDAYLEGVIPGAGYTLLTVVPFKNGFAVVGCTDKYNSNAFVADIKVNKKSLRFRALASGEYFAICIGDCAVVTKNEYSVRENQFRFVLKKNETVKILRK